MQMKKVLAVVMSLCMTAGVVSYGAPVISQVITAQAESVEGSCYSFDASTGELRLRGTVDDEVIRVFTNKQNVKTVIAEEGTILPENCGGLFTYYQYCTSIDLSKADTSRVTNMNSMFNCCRALTSLDLSGFDTSKVTDMSAMFADCEALAFLNVSSFDTSKVTNMNGMFYDCRKLASPDESGFDLSGFDTRNVTDMGRMFYNCSELSILDVSNFNTSKVTDMNNMFNACRKLGSPDTSGFDVSEFDTGNVTNMNSMFWACNNLTSLDVSNFDTSKVTDMKNMFGGCNNLTSLDLSSFDTSNITDKDTYMGMRCMFCNCSALETIYTSYSWADPSVCPVTYSEGMFADAANLVGGNGTVYDKNVVGLSYAWIDSDEHPGYFTYKEVSVSTSLTTTAFTETRKVMLYGDTTQDDVFDISDVVLTCRFLAGDVTATIKDAGIASADVDGDGQVTSNDITLMLKKIGMRQTFDALQ